MGSWARKTEQVKKALTTALTPFLKTRLPEVKAADVAQDFINSGYQISMDRSATRLRRRLYAQWGKWDLVGGELVHLTGEGIKVRDAALQPDPREVGDIFVDLFRVAAISRTLGGVKQRLSPADRVAFCHLLLNTVRKETASTQPPFTPEQVGVLLTLHSVEASRQVRKDTVHGHVKRFFPQWNLTPPSEADVATHLQTLENAGAIKSTDDGTAWFLNDRIVFPW
ncbi:MAG: hypothetical protein AB2A00_24135 [Myxococcota bacterium]